MYTVYDYVKYYGDYLFETLPFNDMDNIVFVSLAYIPFEKILFKDNMPLNEMISLLDEIDIKPHTMAYRGTKLLKCMYNTRRYKDIEISNFVNILDDKTQFSAISIRFQKKHLYVAYRGTDNSLTGWKEDFELSYIYPIAAQKHASNYLMANIKTDDSVIYIGGHSKGGNLAMASAFNLPVEIINKIAIVYNNDGPGFLDKQVNSKDFKNISSKIKTFIPEESIVGLLLENPMAYIPIKSTKQGISQHDPTSWLCFGQFLIQGNTSKMSLKFQEKINNWLEVTTKEDKKNLVNTFFKILNESKITHFSELKNIKFDGISAMIKETKNIDEKSKKMLLETLKALFDNGGESTK